MNAALRRWLLYSANRPFRWLWWSQTISLFGTQVSLVAIPLLAAIGLSASAIQMGLLVAVETGAYLLASIPAGIATDRLDRRRLLIAANVGRAVLLLAVPVGAALNWLSLPLLFSVSAGVGLFSALFDVAYQSYVPELLSRDNILDGNQRIEMSESAARTLGPGFAGGLIAVLGGAAAVTIDAISYLAAALALLGAGRPTASTVVDRGQERIDAERIASRRSNVGRPDVHHEGDEAPIARSPTGGGISAGFGIVLRDRFLRDTAISTGIFNLASSAILAVFILFAARDLGLNAPSIGIIVGLSNIGFVVGALTVTVVTSRLGFGWTLTVAAVLGAVGTVLLPLASGPLAIVFLCAGRFIGAVAIPWFNVNARSLRQTRAPLATLGRVNAVFRLIDWGTLPIGALLGGWIGTAFDLHATLAFGGLLGIASAAWLVASPIRQLHNIEIPGDGWQAAARSIPSTDRKAGPIRGIPHRFKAFGQLSFRWSGLAIAGFALQLALFLPHVNVFGTATPSLYVLSCVAVLACVLRNARMPGLAIIALGGMSNLLAIVFNGGFMPVAAEAARAVGQAPPTGYVTTAEVIDPMLRPLTDIIIVTWPSPVANVYSVGDVLVMLGLVVTVMWVLRSPAAPTHSGSNDADHPATRPPVMVHAGT